MLPIYICDDDRTMLRYLKEQIGKQILIQEYDMTVAFCGTDPEELLAHLRQSQTKRNLYFLDVELKHKKYDGFLLGKEIREIDPHGTMIYITSFGNLAYKTKRNLYFLDVELKHKKYDGFLLGKEIREIDPHGTMIYITSFGNLAYKTFQYPLGAFDYITKDTPEKVSESLTACMRSVAELMVKGNADPMDYNTVKTGERLAFDYITKDTPEKVSESLTACMRSVAELMVKGNADPMDYNTVKTGERFCHVPIDEMIFLRHLPDHILWCCMQDIRELNFRAVFRILRRAACPDISEGASFVLSCP